MSCCVRLACVRWRVVQSSACPTEDHAAACELLRFLRVGRQRAMSASPFLRSRSAAGGGSGQPIECVGCGLVGPLDHVGRHGCRVGRARRNKQLRDQLVDRNPALPRTDRWRTANEKRASHSFLLWRSASGPRSRIPAGFQADQQPISQLGFPHSAEFMESMNST